MSVYLPATLDTLRECRIKDAPTYFQFHEKRA